MADQKPIPVPRPAHGVRRSDTPSGVIHVRTYKANQYVVIGNHLAQHQELSLTAIGLATYILSVPEGTLVDIRTLAERFTEGRERIAAALRELEAHGYLERVREHTAEGRLVTRTYAHHVPESVRQADVTPLPLRAPAARSGGGRPRVQKRHGADAGAQDTSQEGDQTPLPPCPAPARATIPAQAD
ncbi:helix-turn-helix domain-containing protein, partial [Streptomyces sp. NPDC047028]